MVPSRRILATAVFLAGAATAAGGQSSAAAGASPPTAEDIMARAAAAASRVDRARYHAIATRSLILAHEIWRAEGEVTVDRGRGRLFVDGEVRPPGQTGSQRRLLWRTSEGHAFADLDAGTIARGPLATLGGAESEMLWRLGLDALVGTQPFAGERAVEARGPETLPSGEFWVLETVSHDGARQSTWYLATEDMLPRQCDRLTRLDHGEELRERILHGAFEAAPDGVDPTPPESLREVPAADAPPLDAGLEPLDPRGPTPSIAVVDLSAEITPLRSAFEESTGKRRVIGLFAPT